MKRRDFLRTGSAIIVSFAFDGAFSRTMPAQTSDLGKPVDPREVDSFLAIHPDGSVTIYTSKVDVGTGLRIAISQMVAEELEIPVARVTVIEGDTAITPNHGGTGGSTGIPQGGVELRRAAATARQALLKLGAQPGANIGALLGGKRLYERAKEILGDQSEHVTEDGLFTLEEEECLAACDKAPVLAVNYVFYDKVSEDQLAEMISEIREGRVPEASRGGVPGDLREVSRTLAGLSESIGNGQPVRVVKQAAVGAGGGPGEPAGSGLREGPAERRDEGDQPNGPSGAEESPRSEEPPGAQRAEDG